MEKQLQLKSIEDNMIVSLQSIKEIKLKQAQQDEALKILAAKITTDYFTIVGYFSIRGLQVDIRQVNRLEQKAMMLSQEYGIVTGKVSDPDLGDSNTYCLDILGEAFDDR